jgi:hypothetical protein
MFLRDKENEPDGCVLIRNADVGAARPAGMDIRARRAPPPEPEPEAAAGPAGSESSSGDEGAHYRYRTIRDSLQALTEGVPPTRLYDLPRPWQRHVVGLPVGACRLLRRVGTLARFWATHHDGDTD